ncbi:MAG: hypothetical protein L3J63_05805, partial [Geopsychrobacter sp.]|nr:hypothetical protein [Geopsychrobacter sp.]
MRIHHKLLTLLLVFSVVPLLLSIAISHIFFYRAGMHLAEEAERQLSGQAHLTLQKMVNSFQQLQERDRRMMEAALTLQSGQGLSATARSSQLSPSVPLAYRVVMSYRPGTVSRQMTVYTSGLSGCYPANDKCLDADSLKQGEWYRTTARRQVLTRTLSTDPVSGEQAVIVASPLRDGTGHFLGVTALMRPVLAMFTDLRLSEDWFGTARELLVAIEPGDDIAHSKLRILALRKSGSEVGGQPLFTQRLLRPDSSAENQRLMTRLAKGTGGSLELKLAGVETHWIFAAATRGEPFALILVPHSQVIAQAVAAREHVVQKTLK